jgi:hypothetical protein
MQFSIFETFLFKIKIIKILKIKWKKWHKQITIFYFLKSIPFKSLSNYFKLKVFIKNHQHLFVDLYLFLYSIILFLLPKYNIVKSSLIKTNIKINNVVIKEILYKQLLLNSIL